MLKMLMTSIVLIWGCDEKDENIEKKVTSSQPPPGKVTCEAAYNAWEFKGEKNQCEVVSLNSCSFSQSDIENGYFESKSDCFRKHPEAKVVPKFEIRGDAIEFEFSSERKYFSETCFQHKIDSLSEDSRVPLTLSLPKQSLHTGYFVEENFVSPRTFSDDECDVIECVLTETRKYISLYKYDVSQVSPPEEFSYGNDPRPEKVKKYMLAPIKGEIEIKHNIFESEDCAEGSRIVTRHVIH